MFALHCCFLHSLAPCTPSTLSAPGNTLGHKKTFPPKPHQKFSHTVLTSQGNRHTLENKTLYSQKIMQNLLWTKVLQSLALGQHKTTGWVISASMEQDVTNMHRKRGIPEIFPSHGHQGSFTAIAAGEALPQHPQFAELTLPSRKHQVKGKEQQSC